MKLSFIIISLIISTLELRATNYYFSNNGSDTNNGKTHSAPFRSLSRLSRIKLAPGDSILLQKGSVFNASILLNVSGSDKKAIVIAAYGRGAAPILTGAKAVANWSEQKGGVFSAEFDQSVNDLYLNNVRQTSARYPNKGFLNIDSGKNKNVIYSKAVANIPQTSGSTYARIRSIDWVYEVRLFRPESRNAIRLSYHNLYEDANAIKQRTNNGATTIYDLSPNYGFYVDGASAYLDSVSEWSMDGKKILFKPEHARLVSQSKIEAVTAQTGIEIVDNIRNVAIQDVNIQKYFYAGIKVGASAKNILIKNCSISNIGLFGITVDSISAKCTISNNTITDVLGRGISTIEPEEMLIEKNVVKRIGLVPGQGFSGINGATGISVYNHESKTFLKSRYANHNLVRLNIIDSCGYNGLRVDGSYNVIEFNTIENCGLTLNDGSGLYCFAAQTGITHHQIFRRNIVRKSIGNNDATPANGIHFNGIYIDNNCHDILVEENTSADNSSNGMVNNAGSYNNTFINNIVFNNKVGFSSYEWSRPGKLYGLELEKNTFVSLEAEQRLLDDVNYLADSTNFGIYNFNRYISAATTLPFYKETKQIPTNSKLYLTFKDWKSISKQDELSTAIVAGNSILKAYRAELITNRENLEHTFDFTNAKYLDSSGRTFDQPIKLQYNQSIVVFVKK